jgi:hypothetical protein
VIGPDTCISLGGSEMCGHVTRQMNLNVHSLEQTELEGVLRLKTVLNEFNFRALLSTHKITEMNPFKIKRPG